VARGNIDDAGKLRRTVCCIALIVTSLPDSGQLREVVNSAPVRPDDIEVAKLHRQPVVETSPDPRTAISEPAAVPRELSEALAVLRCYVQALVYESESNPCSLERVRAMVTCALTATERAYRAAEPKLATASGASDTVEVIAPSNRTIDVNLLRRVWDASSSNRARLTPREREVLALVTNGFSNKAGGFQLSISIRTFEAHRANIMRKLNARNTAELVRFGLEELKCRA
jgi:DNA-binding NarL/FixJ family response regulator